MKLLERLNQFGKEAHEKMQNARIAKKAKLDLKGQINRVETELQTNEDSMEDEKSSKEFDPQKLWKLEKQRMLLEKEQAFYEELKKELF